MAWTTKGGPTVDRSHHVLPLAWNRDDGVTISLDLPMAEYETFVAAFDESRIVTDLGNGRLSCRLHSPTGFLWAMRRCSCISKVIKEEMDGEAITGQLASSIQADGSYQVRVPTGGKNEIQPTFVVYLQTQKFKGSVWATLFIYEPSDTLLQDVIASPSLGAVDLHNEGRYTLWRMAQPHWKKFLLGQARELELVCSSCGIPYWNPTWIDFAKEFLSTEVFIERMSNYIMLADHKQCFTCWQLTTELPDEKG